MNKKGQILIVEDEQAIREGLVDVFLFHGYSVEACSDGQQGLDRALNETFDLVLLDLMLPTMNGFDVCSAIREHDAALPIIMLTARVSDEDIVAGLKLGADDYVAKPFSVAQLVARVETVLRRAVRPAETTTELTLQDGLRVDVLNLCVLSTSKRDIRFTRREMDVLTYLSSHSSRPVPREELLSEIWGYRRDASIETRTVDIHIAKVRRKIERDTSAPKNLVTIRGAGYRLMLAPSESASDRC